LVFVFFCFQIPGAKYVPQSGQVGKCWENGGDFEISPCLYDSIPKISQIFLKPIIQVPEILGMLKHMGEETREALSDGQVAEVQAQKVRDRSWVDLGDQLSGYVRCRIFWRSTQLDLLSKGSKLLRLSPSCWIFRSFLAFPLQRQKKSKLLGLRVDELPELPEETFRNPEILEALTVTVEEKMEQLGELKVVLP